MAYSLWLESKDGLCVDVVQDLYRGEGIVRIVIRDILATPRTCEMHSYGKSHGSGSFKHRDKVWKVDLPMALHQSCIFQCRQVMLKRTSNGLPEKSMPTTPLSL